jgi:hypothetical protein
MPHVGRLSFQQVFKYIKARLPSYLCSDLPKWFKIKKRVGELSARFRAAMLAGQAIARTTCEVVVNAYQPSSGRHGSVPLKWTLQRWSMRRWCSSKVCREPRIVVWHVSSVVFGRFKFRRFDVFVCLPNIIFVIAQVFFRGVPTGNISARYWQLYPLHLYRRKNGFAAVAPIFAQYAAGPTCLAISAPTATR